MGVYDGFNKELITADNRCMKFLPSTCFLLECTVFTIDWCHSGHLVTVLKPKHTLKTACV